MSETQTSGGLVWTPHPFAMPTAEEIAQATGHLEAEAVLYEWWKTREEAIVAAKMDPLRRGFKPDHWKRARRCLETLRELLLMGGNRSPKSEFCADYSINDLVFKPERLWCFAHSSSESCIRQQMPRLHQYLPPEWRDLGKVGKSVYVNFTKKNGFSDGVFILPNGSQALFFNYMQDPRVLEGYEFDGAWLDELAPLEFVEAIRYRLVTRKGRLLLSFTPVEGYTPVVGKYLAGARVTETAPSPLLPDRVNVKDCPKGHMPVVMRSATAPAHIVFFFTEWNPFNPYGELVEKLQGATDRDVKIRAYGYAEKMGGSAFPKFSTGAHVLKRNVGAPATGMGSLVPPRPWAGVYSDRLSKSGTNYRSVDPAPVKNWVIKWYRVDEWGRFYVYREWPDWGTHGPWAVASKKADGEAGPAQRSDFGRGIVSYKRLMLEAEGWVWRDGRWDGANAEVICHSVIDPRGGGVEAPSADEAKSVLAWLIEPQFNERGEMVGPPMDFSAAPGLRVLEGLDVLNETFDYREDVELSGANCPKWYVLEDCEQSIYAYREYTGIDGEKGALKDIIDPDRYFVTADLVYISQGAMEPRGGGSY